MSSSKAKKKRKKQRLRLKRKKFNLKELLKKLERDRLADLWKKLAASMAAFDNHSGTRGRPIWEDGLGLFCNAKAMKALKPYSQSFEATTNDLNSLQPRAGHSIKPSLNSEAPTARQPPEQSFWTRPPPVQKSQSGEMSVRALVAIPSNVRRVVQSDAILVNLTVPVAPDKFSWPSSPCFQTVSTASIPVLPKTLQGWSDLATVTRSFTGVSFATDQPIGSWLSPSMRRQPLVMVPPSPTAEENSPTVALQQKSGGLLPEKGFTSQAGKKGNKESRHARKKRRRRYTTKYFVAGYAVSESGTDMDDSDSGTSDCDSCTSDGSVYSNEEASDIESDDCNNTGRRQAAKDGEVVQKRNKQTGTPPPLVEDDQKKFDLPSVTLSGITVDNMIHNVVSLDEEVGADVTLKAREIPSVLSSLVPKGPGCGGCSTR